MHLQNFPTPPPPLPVPEFFSNSKEKCLSSATLGCFGFPWSRFIKDASTALSVLFSPLCLCSSHPNNAFKPSC